MNILTTLMYLLSTQDTKMREFHLFSVFHWIEGLKHRVDNIIGIVDMTKVKEFWLVFTELEEFFSSDYDPDAEIDFGGIGFDEDY